MNRYETSKKAIGVVVLVHGAQEHHRRYDWLISKWNDAGFHVVSDDLIGQTLQRTEYGQIESFDQYTKQVFSWVKAAHQYNLPIFLFGHNLGGLILIRNLQEVDLGVAGVILSSPMLGLVERKSEITKSGMFSQSVIKDFGLTADMLTRNLEIIEQVDTLYLAGVSSKWYKEILGAMEVAFNNMEVFEDVPILIVQSGEDQFVDKKKVRYWINNCRSTDKHYKEWEGLYHEVFNEPEREEVFNYTMKFVEMCMINIGYEM